MALQDVCGFQDSALYPACSSSTTVIPDEDNWFYSRSSYKHNSTWREPRAKHGGIPLCFFIPRSQNTLICANHTNAFFSQGSNPSTSVTRPFPLSHGTTTLAFSFQGGVIAAADSRASCAGLVACPTTNKISPIHSHLVVTSSGCGADCMLWERILAREIRLYQLRHGRRLSIVGSAKLLSFMLHPFKGTEVCVALTLCGWDREERGVHSETQGGAMESQVGTAVKSNKGLSVCEIPVRCVSEPLPANALSRPLESEIQRKWEDPEGRVEPFMLSHHDQRTKTQAASNQSPISSQITTTKQSGPRLCYVCSDGTFLRGELFSVGSGSPYAYSVLDGAVRWEMCEEEAVSVAREAVYRATHRDAYSGNNVDIFHITARGWRRREREDLREEYYRERLRRRGQMKVREREETKGNEERMRREDAV
ncbi:proteasome subunit beta type-11a [Clupea harengus]|uniref:Proteasome subunit beta type-11a n=1 Tax=Clupea harengus TaxID=7950 RepID=A0A6P8EJM7_CLUHA|nr:proteasome subunit beta type-11a [Clupea harengus]